MLHENTPLLPSKAEKPRRKSDIYRILFCAFVISLSVAFTWVPMIYVFRIMTCEAYYKTHEPFPGTGDRCNVREIDASTAKAVSLLGSTTTVFGVVNMIWAGWTIKRFGVKVTLINQTVWPALRLCCQIIGVTIGATTGIMMIQITQFICMLGGPAGYLLALNTYVSEVVEPSQRTQVFGQLSGCVMFGTAFGYFLGGLSGDLLGIRTPFEIAFFLMIFSTIYSISCLPYIPPLNTVSESPEKKTLGSFFGPAKLFKPQKIQLKNGAIQSYWGVFLLGAGVFMGVLATGFIPILIQMYATNAFGFRPTENGYLMSFNSLVRGVFLTFAFPKIISRGRLWYGSCTEITPTPESDEIPSSAIDFEVIPGLESELEPPANLTNDTSDHGSEFDLFFLRWSLVVDGALTASAAFSTKGWHIYIAAFLLPLASGSAPAAKGVMMDMCQPSQRADALSAITLVEMAATLSTISIFGIVFAALAEIGKPHLVFIVNATVAIFSVLLLAFCRFPPKNKRRVVGEENSVLDTVN